MSGHSKWSTIKRQKGLADAKRSQMFTKLVKVITAAARQGPDPDMNFKLRLAIERARSASMPKDSIERAIKRGGGDAGGANELIELTYEGYGPGGVAFLIEVLTDNRNRTTANLRHLLERFGGRLAETGSVTWLFAPQGIIQLALPISQLELLELALIEAGANDIKEEADGLIIYCEPEKFDNIKNLLSERQLSPTYSTIEPVAKNLLNIEDKNLAAKLDSLREALDNDDDVNNFYDNAA